MSSIAPACEPFSLRPERNWGVDRRLTADEWIRPRKASALVEVLLWSAEQPQLKRVQSTSSELEQAIEKSRWILALAPDWDDDGAKPISEACWAAATALLRRTSESVKRRQGLELIPPVISPCADGSLDLLWRNGAFKLLVNIQPAGESDLYGEFGSTSVRGSFDAGVQDVGVAYCLLQS